MIQPPLLLKAIKGKCQIIIKIPPKGTGAQGSGRGESGIPFALSPETRERNNSSLDSKASSLNGKPHQTIRLSANDLIRPPFAPPIK